VYYVFRCITVIAVEFVEFLQDELPCIADHIASFARNTDVIEKELQECDDLIQKANLGSSFCLYVFNLFCREFFNCCTLLNFTCLFICGLYIYICLQCFDTVGWASGRASGP